MSYPVTFERRQSSQDRRRTLRGSQRREAQETPEERLAYDKETWGDGYPDIDSPRLRPHKGRRRGDQWH